MDGLLDRTSPRRGSLNSLHRQSSGSISSIHNPKYATPSQHQASNSNNTASTSSNGPDIDKYTRYFIIKAVQIIVQSRIGSINEFKSECKPNGNDWFNINLIDIPEVSERTKAAIDSDNLGSKTNWRVCCEISVNPGDGTKVVLEQWMITNRIVSLIAPPNSIVGSPTMNSLNISNKLQAQSNIASNASTTSNSNSPQSSQQQNASNNVPSSIYAIYNRMTLLLKTLMTTTHIVPAFRFASKITRPSVICYRVFTVASSPSCQNLSSPNLPSRNINNNNGHCSLNTTDFHITADENDPYFGPTIKLGSIKTETNELSLSYRTDLNSSNYLQASSKTREHRDWNQARTKGSIQDEEYLIAAKQLLAGSGAYINANLKRGSDEKLDILDKPLSPAFATRIANMPRSNSANHNNDDVQPNKITNQNGSNGELFESAFDSLLKRNGNGDSEKSDDIRKAANTTLACTKLRIGAERSANIQVPTTNNNRSRNNTKPRSGNEHSTGSTPKSLSDSFVFVDINPPFASEEQNDINSFFHGPSPSFSNGFDSLLDVDELKNQLANIESNASQFDDFIDNICASDDEEGDN